MLINIGLSNLVAREKIVSVVSPEAAPIKRAVALAKENRKLIDATGGRKTKSVIFFDSDQIVLSYLSPEVIEARVNMEDNNEQR